MYGTSNDHHNYQLLVTIKMIHNGPARLLCMRSVAESWFSNLGSEEGKTVRIHLAVFFRSCTVQIRLNSATRDKAHQSLGLDFQTGFQISVEKKGNCSQRVMFFRAYPKCADSSEFCKSTTDKRYQFWSPPAESYQICLVKSLRSLRYEPYNHFNFAYNCMLYA